MWKACCGVTLTYWPIDVTPKWPVRRKSHFSLCYVDSWESCSTCRNYFNDTYWENGHGLSNDTKISAPTAWALPLIWMSKHENVAGFLLSNNKTLLQSFSINNFQRRRSSCISYYNYACCEPFGNYLFIFLWSITNKWLQINTHSLRHISIWL